MAVPAFSWWRGLALVVAAAACVIGLVYSGIAWRVDASLYDAMLGANQTEADDRILVVAIDEGSIAALGRWPWSRGVHAQLIDRLSKGQPRAIALDVMFAERDAAEPAGDDALAGAIARNGRVVLPVMVEPAEPGGIPVEVLPLPAMVQASAGLGHAAVDVDPDGVTRSAYLQAGLGEPHWPALGLALLRAGRSQAAGVLPGARAPTLAQATPYQWRQDHRVLVPYPDAATIQQASYVDVLRGRIDPGMLRGKWILVGATAHGLGERVLTPGHAGEVRIPGVLYQASLASMLLRGDAITPASAKAIAAGSIALALLPLLALWRWPRLSSWLVGAGGALLALAASALLLAQARVWWPPTATLIALLLALSLLAAYRYRRSHRLAHSDALTRLANRRMFDLILERESLASRRSGKPTSLLLVDVDNFKHYNDRCGHRAGDAMLQAVAARLAARVGRPRDLCARYGGDEFAAILPETDAASAGKLAAQLVRDVAALAMPHPQNDGAAVVTVSIGVAACNPEGETTASLLERADAALYKAKEAGRNRHVVAPALAD